MGMTGLSACAPPSLRSAHSLDQGKLAVELAAVYDRTDVQAELYTLEDNTAVTSAGPVTEHITGDVTVRIGLGAGFELGVSPFAPHVKYSILDERRHDGVPLSLALTVQGGVRYVGAGLLLSRQLDLGGIALRPVANVWYQTHASTLSWTLPEASVVEEPDVVNPGAEGTETDAGVAGILTATVDVTELSVPVGIEVPIAVSDTWDLVPFAAYAVSVPLQTNYRGLSCADCLAGVGNLAVQRRSFVWVGLKFQPTLKRPGAVASTAQPAPSEASP
jgi:hypothetical protein